jgi:hypothetical protein
LSNSDASREGKADASARLDPERREMAGTDDIAAEWTDPAHGAPPQIIPEYYESASLRTRTARRT